MPASTRSGTQSIERAAQVLRVLAERGRFGWGVVDLAARCGLSRATAHRILSGLVRERLAWQRADDRRYFLGPLVFELGLAMPAQARFQAACKAPVTRLARGFGTQASLSLRSGHDSVCAVCVGTSPYASGFEVGSRHPLVATAGGVAILIRLADPDKQAAKTAGLKQLARLGPAALRRFDALAARSERLGYAFNQGDRTKGVNSFGLPIAAPDGIVFASLVVSGHAEDFPASRAGEVVQALREEVAAIEGSELLPWPAHLAPSL